jgi:hypothetical protein
MRVAGLESLSLMRNGLPEGRFLDTGSQVNDVTLLAAPLVEALKDTVVGEGR